MSSGEPAAEGLEVVLERGCMNNLLWRVELPGNVEASSLVELMVAGHWCETRQVPGLRFLRDPFGHTLVIVERTGRVQVRVNYTFPNELRPIAAKAVGIDLGRICARLGGDAAGG